MAQFSQGFRLDLADTFAGDGKMLSDFFERVFRSGVPKPEAHLDDLFFTRCQRRQNFVGDLAKIRNVTDSAGFRIDLSSIKSPRCESSSSPIGVSSEMGS